MITLYDDIYAENIPADAEYMAGYIDGNWPSYFDMINRFPNAKRIYSITTWLNDADILDVETGDATPDQAPKWVDRQRQNGKSVIIVYSNTATYPDLVNAFTSQGVIMPPFWEANYDNNPTISSYAAGKQYQSLDQYDISVIDPAKWPGLPIIGEDDMQPQDFFKHLPFKQGGYINLRRNGEADIPPNTDWQPYTVLRADGAEYQFPFGQINMYSQLPAQDREIADPKQDYIVDAWQ